MSSAFLNRPRFGFDVDGDVEAADACEGSGFPSTSSTASFSRDRLAFLTKSTPAVVDDEARRRRRLAQDDDDEEDDEATRTTAAAAAAALVLRRTGRRPRRGVGGARRRRQILVVLRAQRRIHEDPVRLGQIGGDPRGHLLELLPEMLDLVGVVARDLAAERLLDLVGRRSRARTESMS